ncbi:MULTISPECIES: ArdC-like ssDNA-binding domain-containing protein [Aerococcus]|nr:MULTISPECIES: ArdC family protein [Aerococcus]MDK6371637.1 ArdC-like ssDNA-binding domain-containing protein [Aerococcus urinae]MDK6597062.1 ArdC-like ssDNA-binding domain-containing protein [Aerococcus urinae]MDK7802026.1 ArdC-like ssDNA-binding domain-containing protein [Aerococcus urinae]MDK8655613.1 ArdC-like ssDNA-binding domain-containing protein [Aerococcus urinae]MDL5178552.1 ArdC-like ssDNA-binding domain-containing protein [Aerococcus tenax]
MDDYKRQAQLYKLSNMLNESIDNYIRDPEQLKEFFTFKKGFHNYSYRNTFLIDKQYKGAIQVASYKKWQEKGYQVKKGQKALRILAPTISKALFKKTVPYSFVTYLSQATDEQKQALKNGELSEKEITTGFIPVPVFDITQTDCPIEDYPDLIRQFYVVGQTEKYDELNQALHGYRESKKIGWYETRPQNIQQSSANGFYVPNEKKLWIDPNLNVNHYLYTFVHELAHSQLHNNRILDKGMQEFQAELSAGIVLNYYGIDTKDATSAYVQPYVKDMSIEQKEELIFSVISFSETLTSYVDKYLEKEFDLTPELEKELNNVVALNNYPERAKEFSNVYDPLSLDKDNDGVIDRFDADERDSKVQEISDLDNREKNRQGYKSLRDRLQEKKESKATQIEKKPAHNLGDKVNKVMHSFNIFK